MFVLSVRTLKYTSMISGSPSSDEMEIFLRTYTSRIFTSCPPHVSTRLAQLSFGWDDEEKETGYSALHVASAINDIAVVELLHETYSFDLELVDRVSKAPLTPIMLAMWYESYDVLKFLHVLPEEKVLPLTVRVLLLDICVPESYGDAATTTR